jgi:hypothetical protein
MASGRTTQSAKPRPWPGDLARLPGDRPDRAGWSVRERAAGASWVSVGRGGRTFLRVQNALILREIATRYGRTPGGVPLGGGWNRWPPFWC